MKDKHTQEEDHALCDSDFCRGGTDRDIPAEDYRIDPYDPCGTQQVASEEEE